MNLVIGWVSAGLMLLMFAASGTAQGDTDIPAMLETPRPLAAPDTLSPAPDSRGKSVILAAPPPQKKKSSGYSNPGGNGFQNRKGMRRPPPDDPKKRKKPTKPTANGKSPQTLRIVAFDRLALDPNPKNRGVQS